MPGGKHPRTHHEPLAGVQSGMGARKGSTCGEVAGVRYGHRQAALAHLTMYPENVIHFHLLRERENLYDVNAVAVSAEVLGKGQYKMGYLNRPAAALVAPVMDRGET